ncbi:MAG: hypothetical protein ABFS16_06495 [Bacteroidota bacterium]
MAFIRKNIRLLFVLILPVYFYIVQSSIQNKHTHFFANGIVVTHSHPLEKSGDAPVNQHNHTKSEIILIQCLNFDFYETPGSAEANFTPDEFHKNFFISNDQVAIFSPYLKSIPRGPPV